MDLPFPKRKSPRAEFIKYDDGTYFVTICTEGKRHFFGHIHNGEMHYSKIGAFTNDQLSKANSFRKDIEVPQFVVMPNHLHAIVIVKTDSPDQIMDIDFSGTSLAQCRIDQMALDYRPERKPKAKDEGNETLQHNPALCNYVASMKGAVTKYANRHDITFGWQRSFHDHRIINADELNHIDTYIRNNVESWWTDCHFTAM